MNGTMAVEEFLKRSDGFIYIYVCIYIQQLTGGS